MFIAECRTVSEVGDRRGGDQLGDLQELRQDVIMASTRKEAAGPNRRIETGKYQCVCQ